MILFGGLPEVKLGHVTFVNAAAETVYSFICVTMSAGEFPSICACLYVQTLDRSANGSAGVISYGLEDNYQRSQGE